MGKRFLIHEGEKNYIRKMYGFINEQQEDTSAAFQKYKNLTQQATNDQVKRFQDYMDTKGPWVKTKTGKFVKLNKGGGYGTFGPNTKAAWNKYGKEFLEMDKNYENFKNSQNVSGTTQTNSQDYINYQNFINSQNVSGTTQTNK